MTLKCQWITGKTGVDVTGNMLSHIDSRSVGAAATLNTLTTNLSFLGTGTITAPDTQGKRSVGRIEVEVEVCCFHSLRIRLVSKRKLANAGVLSRSGSLRASPLLARFISPLTVYIPTTLLFYSLLTQLSI
jgi:hypothetical protein